MDKPATSIDEDMVYELISLADADDPHFFSDQVCLFYSRYRQLLATLRDAVCKGDSSALRVAAHSLKGSSSLIGATIMYWYCQQIEEHAAREDFSAAHAAIDEIEDEYLTVKNYLDSAACIN